MSATVTIQDYHAACDLDGYAVFCRAHGGKHCFQWPTMNLVRNYLKWHRAQRNLAIVETFGQVKGVGVAWRAFKENLDVAELSQQHAFTWRQYPHGDCLFVAEVVAASREAFRDVVRTLYRQRPDWRALPVYTFRKDRRTSFCKLVELKPKLLARLRAGKD